jgi:hypothetical protein
MHPHHRTQPPGVDHQGPAGLRHASQEFAANIHLTRQNLLCQISTSATKCVVLLSGRCRYVVDRAVVKAGRPARTFHYVTEYDKQVLDELLAMSRKGDESSSESCGRLLTPRRPTCSPRRREGAPPCSTEKPWSGMKVERSCRLATLTAHPNRRIFIVRGAASPISATTRRGRSTSGRCSNDVGRFQKHCTGRREEPFTDVPVRFLAFVLLRLDEERLLDQPYKLPSGCRLPGGPVVSSWRRGRVRCRRTVRTARCARRARRSGVRRGR